MIRLFLFVCTLCLSAAALAEWVGAKAPAFALPDQTGKVRTLDEFRGRWLVLYFYPRDATPGCTQEAQQFRDRYADSGGRASPSWASAWIPLSPTNVSPRPRNYRSPCCPTAGATCRPVSMSWRASVWRTSPGAKPS